MSQPQLYFPDGSSPPPPPEGWDQPLESPREKIAAAPTKEAKRDGGELWGDKLERYLKLAGITQEKYKAVKKNLGFSEECGCLERKEKLNIFNQRVDKVGWGRAVYELIRSA